MGEINKLSSRVTALENEGSVQKRWTLEQEADGHWYWRVIDEAGFSISDGHNATYDRARNALGLALILAENEVPAKAPRANVTSP